MDSGRHFEQVLQGLIENITSQLKLWEQRRLEAEEQVRILSAKLEAYQMTLRDCWEANDNKKQ